MKDVVKMVNDMITHLFPSDTFVYFFIINFHYYHLSCPPEAGHFYWWGFLKLRVKKQANYLCGI